MKQAVGYARVSTYSQASEGVSLEAQKEKIEAWAKLSGLRLKQVYIDAGISGFRSDNRPALKEALFDVKACKGVLVVYSLSRLARSTRDTLQISDQLNKSGADLVSLSEKLDTSSASGKMVFRILATLSEFERDIISERTKAALSHLKRQGRRVGKIPFGFQLNTKGNCLEKKPSEQKCLMRIMGLRNSGASLREICSTLQREGFSPKSSTRWHPQVIRGILNGNKKENQTDT